MVDFACGSGSQESLQDIDVSLLDPQAAQAIHDTDGYSKTLGIEWSVQLNSFHLTVVEVPQPTILTKRILGSNVAKTFDVLGWFAPSVIMVKILLQRLWEAGVGCDDLIPKEIHDSWKKLQLELPVLTTKLIPCCYYPRDVHIVPLQLHGFSDPVMVYVRLVDSSQTTHVSLDMSKTKVVPLKHLTVPYMGYVEPTCWLSSFTTSR